MLLLQLYLAKYENGKIIFQNEDYNKNQKNDQQYLQSDHNYEIVDMLDDEYEESFSNYEDMCEKNIELFSIDNYYDDQNQNYDIIPYSQNEQDLMLQELQQNFELDHQLLMEQDNNIKFHFYQKKCDEIELKQFNNFQQRNKQKKKDFHQKNQKRKSSYKQSNDEWETESEEDIINNNISINQLKI